MKYVTAIELSKEWGITNRMITIHCKNGRISGAIKKGTVWLIPANAQKPSGKRSTMSNVVTIDENIAKKGMSSIENKAEIGSDESIYSPRDMNIWGLTRDTLRYYEKIELIEPRRKIENSYREFDVTIHSLFRNTRINLPNHHCESI